MCRPARWFLGLRLSRRGPTERYPYGLERAEDLAGIGIAVVIWASEAFAGWESVRKLLENGSTSHVGLGIFGAALGIAGNQVVARYKLVIGRRINSATLVADARHSWLDALSSLGALVGLVAVALGFRWADPLVGIAVTLFTCHVGYEVTADVVHRLADGVDPAVISSAGAVDGVVHAHARARWTGRTLRGGNRSLGRPGPHGQRRRHPWPAGRPRGRPAGPRYGQLHLARASRPRLNALRQGRPVISRG